MPVWFTVKIMLNVCLVLTRLISETSMTKHDQFKEIKHTAYEETPQKNHDSPAAGAATVNSLGWYRVTCCSCSGSLDSVAENSRRWRGGWGSDWPSHTLRWSEMARWTWATQSPPSAASIRSASSNTKYLNGFGRNYMFNCLSKEQVLTKN